MSDTPAPNPGPTPTGYQRTSGGKGFKWQPPTAEHLSKLLPQYEIESILGHGGMGAVYKGKQKSLDRLVAIKILPPELDDEDASYVERFKNEAKVMAKFIHPAIVAVHDFGETTEGQLYIVMEYVDGTDVQKMIQSQGRLPPEHALAITAHVCDALRYAHEHGVIHRDIKPANILINMEGAVKVADFGLAKADEAGTSGLTKTGMAMGTPDYVAPEALVMGVNVDGRADLYAIGVMLYNMLTGNVPRGMFKPASVMLPGTDPRYDAIIAKAMQHDRDDRYQSAAEIRSDLDVILTTPLVQAGGQSSAAIPKQAIAQKPMGKSANVPVRKEAATPAPNPKSKAPLFIGIAAIAAIAVGAFVMSSRARQSVGGSPPASATPTAHALAGAATSSPPIKVREEPKPAPVAVTSPPKPEPPKPAPEKKAEPKPIAAAPASPSLPVSSTPTFPPGQWVKVFTKFEDLPADLRKPDSGVKFEDGWIRTGDNNIGLRMTEVPSKNAGIRTRVRFDPVSKGYSSLNLRNSNAGRLILSRDRTGGLHRISWVIGKSEHRSLATFDLGRSFLTGEHIVEFCAVGDQAICRFDDRLNVTKLTDRVESGSLFLGGSEDLRDIEVINLDGLPEAEALRILGVDEKGNDLRALAAKQEQQMAEQAKAADAMAAIPELKGLQEQFTKLTTERVNVPFEADVAKLNSGYIGGIDRKIAEERGKGNLDGVLALEAEKKLVAAVDVAALARAWSAIAPVPADDEQTTATLKTLRQIYRDAFAKLEATRVTNLKLLTDPLSIRLKQLESALTQSNRIEHAKTVREYREALGRAEGPPSAVVAAPQTAIGGPSALPTSALKDGFTNSLGMKFVPVKETDVLFCIHEVRYSEYAAYAAETPGIDGSWKDQTCDGYALTENKENHPVMEVNWEDAQKFCAWLSKKEGKTYRLPTDQEWSYAVGIGQDEKWKKDTTPATVTKSQTDFPWGDKWPPPKDSGNYSDESRKAKAPNASTQYLENYDDGFPTTAPVMSFKPNKLGLYDLEGNAREWVEDRWDNAKADRVLRGGCWNDHGRAHLLSSYRHLSQPGGRGHAHGFRVVVETRIRQPLLPKSPAEAQDQHPEN